MLIITHEIDFTTYSFLMGPGLEEFLEQRFRNFLSSLNH